MCSLHYQQAKRGKRPFVLPSRFLLPKTATAEERFWIKVEKTDTCWLWTAATMKNGYGRFDRILAHHFLVGKPPEGYEWDHLCFIRNCVRPDHLELVTRAENHRRQRRHGGGPSTSPYCKNGHLWSENTNVLPSGKRQCRACIRENMRRFRGGGPKTAVTQCKHGHPFTDDNTYYRKNGSRSCRTCSREKAARYRQQAKDPLEGQSSPT
ncbi:hypothetical protein EB72_24865 [Mycobacterium sp. SWH-M1]|nr:hypothetical protein EB72_24865 [Mycobacterium sp. SWH-M1]